MENTAISGTAQEQKLYELIWKRTIASQMASAKVTNTDVRIACDRRDEKFQVKATKIIFDGFLKVYMEGSDDEPQDEGGVILPHISVGDIFEAKGLAAECKFTEAPLRYSEASLVKKLEELGIGRPSTYAPTISTLTSGRGYIVKGNKDGARVEVTNLALSGSTISEKVKTETVGAERGKLFPQEIGIVVTDYLVKNFPDILDFDFTANVEKDFDLVADGKRLWNDVIREFYAPFHAKVSEAISDKEYANVSREIGVAPDGELLIAKFGKYGPYIQKGDPAKRQFANLAKGQLIESITVEDAMKLFELPRTVGEKNGIPVVVTKGRFGPYIKFGSQNVSLPKKTDPMTVTLEECLALIGTETAQKATTGVIQDFPSSGIKVLSGRYGPYIKYGGKNFKMPRGKNPASISEEECKKIVSK